MLGTWAGASVVSMRIITMVRAMEIGRIIIWILLVEENSACPNQASRPLFRESVKRRTRSEMEMAERNSAPPFFDKI